MKKLVFLLVAAIGALSVDVQGQTPRLFDVDRDLTSSLINYLYQDRYGMVWVATEEGLNCFDGNKFRRFRHDDTDTTTICSNFINSLFEDTDGTLYVCTNRGVQEYAAAKRRFGALLLDHDGKPFTASVVQAVKRSNGDFWLIGDSIRILKNTGAGAKGAIRLEKAPQSCRALKHLHCGVADREGNVWLSLSERGLVCVGPDNKLKSYFGKKSDPSVSCMTIGKDGLLYIGTTDRGLMRYDSEHRMFEPLSPSTGKEIKNLYSDSDGRILQATDGTGVVIYDPSDGTTSRMQFGNRLLSSGNAKAHCLLRDDCDNLWIGMFQTGVAMLPASGNAFGYLGANTEKNDVIGTNCISSIFKDSSGTLWVGADNDGIYALNPDLTRKAHLYNDEISVPMCLFEDSRGNLWAGTYLSGAGMVDRTTGRMKRLQVAGAPGLAANMCFSITEDRDHNVWLGMMHSGLIRYNLDRGVADIDFPWRDKTDPFIASLYYSPTTNQLYIGTYSGLQVVSNLSQSNATVKRLLSKDIVHSIAECKDGLIWMGTTDGVVSYDSRSGKLRRYGVADGLPSSTVYAVRCEGENVWMSLNNGIARLDSRSGKIATFSVGDGLQGNEFYKNSVFKDPEGRIYFGGTGGITYFNPRDISDPGRVWSPRIVDIYAHGIPIEGDAVPFEARKFSLASDANTFSVEFGTKELGRPETVRFAYSLDGKDWEILPPGTYTVNFYDLSPGSHTLAFRTIDGFTESPEQEVTLAVAYPWFASPWSKAAYAVLILLLFWAVVQNYQHRMRSKARLVELQHSDQLNEARIRSYVNISHEIRTPMSLIISPLQKLMATDHDSLRQREYRLIMRNAKRVLRLIDELMDLRRIEKHQMNLTFKPTELVPFIQDVCDTFAQTVADKQQTLAFIYTDAAITADIDTANFDKILMNLFSNAVKYTPIGGTITVSLCVEGDEAVIRFIDTGPGIPPGDRARIFERFYRVKGNSAGGTGVGLHLTHQLVALHGGELSVEDNPEGEGACFIVRVPLRHPEQTAAHGAYDHTARLAQMKIPAPEPADGAQLAASSRGKVLIVEDDEEIRQYLAAELSRHFRVETCSNGREALDIIFRNPPAIILSDVMMPVMDGLQLTKAIKQNINLKNIPVVLLTALNQDEDNINAINAGADAYFVKPFNIEVIKERIAALLSHYRELKNLYSGRQEHDDQIDSINMEGNDEKLMRRVMAVINKNLNDPGLSVEKLASEVGMSRVHLHRKLKELTNQSPSDFIRNTRLRQATNLLREKKLSIAEVAYATGFNSASTFSTAFKRLFGMTPSEYVGRPEE